MPLWIVFKYWCVLTGHDACTAVCLSVASNYSLCLDVFNAPVTERMSRRVAISWGERANTINNNSTKQTQHWESDNTYSHISGIEAALIWLLEREKYNSRDLCTIQINSSNPFNETKLRLTHFQQTVTTCHLHTSIPRCHRWLDEHIW